MKIGRERGNKKEGVRKLEEREKSKKGEGKWEITVERKSKRASRYRIEREEYRRGEDGNRERG